MLFFDMGKLLSRLSLKFTSMHKFNLKLLVVVSSYFEENGIYLYFDLTSHIWAWQ